MSLEMRGLQSTISPSDSNSEAAFLEIPRRVVGHISFRKFPWMQSILAFINSLVQEELENYLGYRDARVYVRVRPHCHGCVQDRAGRANACAGGCLG